MVGVETAMTAGQQQAVLDLLAAMDELDAARRKPVSRFTSPSPTRYTVAIRRRNRMIRQAKEAGLPNRTIADICGIALASRVDLIVEAAA